MWHHSETTNRLNFLTNQVRLAQAVTPDLVLEVIDGACKRLSALARCEKADRLKRLIEAGAWTEVALSLVELELPQWQLRRLVRDDGKWLCMLSKYPNLPAEFDDTVDVSHESLPLALLSAILEAQQQVTIARGVIPPRAPNVRPAAAYAAYCDNFS